jgi:site-specific recombinase XerD
MRTPKSVPHGSHLPQIRTLDRRLLTSAEFSKLKDVPPEQEWFANIESPGTRRIYRVDLRDFMKYTGIQAPEEFRIITRAHVITFRDELQRRGLQGPTIRRKLAAVSSLFEYLCNRNTIATNPVKGVARPKVDSYEGKTPAVSDAQVRRLLSSPEGPSLKATRDRAILSVLFYHALRREELCRLSIKDIHERRGVKHLRIYGKGEKLRYVPMHPGSLDRVNEYLDAAGHGALPSAPLFKPIRNNRRGTTDTALTADGVYQILKFYGMKVGISVDRFGPHSARATAATDALDQGADIAKVQEWLGHANVTTRLYDRSKVRPEDTTFRLRY